VQANPGRILVFKDYYGSAKQSTLTLTTQGSDLIDDYNISYAFSNAYGTLTLISDGFSSWRLMGFYPGSLSFASANNPLALIPTSGSVLISFLGPAIIQFTITFGQNTSKCNYYITTGQTPTDVIPNLSGVTSSNGVLLTRYASFFFLPGFVYYLVVVPFDAIGLQGQQFISPGVLCQNLPQAPLNLTLSINSTGIVSISWSPALDAITYSVVLYQSTTNDYTTGVVFGTSTTSSTSASFSQALTPAYYYVSIWSVNLGGTSAVVTSSVIYSSYSSLTTFQSTSNPQNYFDGYNNYTYQVPPTVSSLYVYLWGGGGGAGNYGGAGACIQGVLAVTPGETLGVSVGSGGYPNYNTALYGACGSGGKKASIKRNNVEIVVAGGGGGSGVTQDGPIPAYAFIHWYGGVGGRASHTNQSYSGGFSFASQVQARTNAEIIALGGSTQYGGGANTFLGDGVTQVAGGPQGGFGYTNGGAGFYPNGGGNPGYSGGGGSSYTANLTLIPGQITLGFTSSNYTAVGTNIIGYVTFNPAIGAGANIYVGPGYGFGGNALVLISLRPLGYSGVLTSVQGLTISILSRTATLSWTAFSGAQSYSWSLYNNSDSTFRGLLYVSGTTTATSVQVSLGPAGYYYFTVVATTSALTTDFSSSTTILILNDPTGLAITISSETALLSWNPVTGISNYIWTLYSNTTNTNSGGTYLTSASTSASTASYSFLSPGYYYYFTLYVGSSTSATVVTSTTTAVNYISPIPTVSLTASNTLDLILTYPAASIISWTLYSNTVNAYGGTQVASGTITGQNSSAVASYLTPSASLYYYLTESIDRGALPLGTSLINQPVPPTSFTASGTYVVPATTSSLYVYLWGAGGGGGDGGGAGACVLGILSVTSGETLNIVVGTGGGINYNSFYSPNCGGGGGKTAIQRGTTDIVVAGGGGGGGSYQGSSGGFGGRATHTTQSYSGGSSYAAQVLGRIRTDISSLGGDNRHGGGGNTTLGNGQEGVDYGLGGGGGGGYTTGGPGGIGGFAGGGGSSYTANISVIPGQSGVGFTSSNNTAVGTKISGFQNGVSVGSIGIGSGGNGLVILSRIAISISI
jgi:hypothetical protein